MPIGKNSLKRVTNNGYSAVKTSAPDMENSSVLEPAASATKADPVSQKTKEVKPSAAKSDVKTAPKVDEKPAPKAEDKPTEKKSAPKAEDKPAAKKSAPKAEDKPAAKKSAPKADEKPAAKKSAPKADEKPAAKKSAPKAEEKHEESAEEISLTAEARDAETDTSADEPQPYVNIGRKLPVHLL